MKTSSSSRRIVLFRAIWSITTVIVQFLKQNLVLPLLFGRTLKLFMRALISRLCAARLTRLLSSASRIITWKSTKTIKYLCLPMNAFSEGKTVIHKNLFQQAKLLFFLYAFGLSDKNQYLRESKSKVFKKIMSDYIVSARKYRPVTFDSVSDRKP